jgi:hypothetical protein
MAAIGIEGARAGAWRVKRAAGGGARAGLRSLCPFHSALCARVFPCARVRARADGRAPCAR